MATTTAVWRSDDINAAVEVLNANVPVFVNPFKFHGWHPRGAFFREPSISGNTPDVFGRVSQGAFTLQPQVFGNLLTAPQRSSTFLVEVFSSVRDREIWSEVFEGVVSVLATLSPEGMTVIGRQFEEPIDNDVPGDIFPSYFAFVGILPYHSAKR